MSSLLRCDLLTDARRVPLGVQRVRRCDRRVHSAWQDCSGLKVVLVAVLQGQPVCLSSQASNQLPGLSSTSSRKRSATDVKLANVQYFHGYVNSQILPETGSIEALADYYLCQPLLCSFMLLT
jgi:hypothetical protein